MNKEMFLNISQTETRAALVEQGVLQEIFIERANCLGIVGNIYHGVVKRVLPGMQASFVDIGLERTAFLHIDDVKFAGSIKSDIKNYSKTSIENILSEGQSITVQVVKDPIATKGARLTMYLSIYSSYMVLLPNSDVTGISQKITDEQERQRLKDIFTDFNTDDYGYIVRTLSEGVSEKVLKREINLLKQQWEEIYKIKVVAGVVQTIFQGLTLEKRVVRDMLGSDISRILIDSKLSFKNSKLFAEKYMPEFSNKIEYYEGESPIFEMCSIEDEIKKALLRKVFLKSGGHLVIDKTEAMTTIDVNTGTFVGTKNLEETVFKTNLEATQAIAKQLRLRNLGGIIVIDFIDMLLGDHKDKVLRSLRKYLKNDSAKTFVTDFSPLGLVEMTRKRTRDSLENILCEDCPSCEGSGSIKTAQTTSYEIFREVIRVSRLFEVKFFMVLASQSTIDYILDVESKYFFELEEFVKKKIKLQPEVMYAQDQFDVVLV